MKYNNYGIHPCQIVDNDGNPVSFAPDTTLDERMGNCEQCEENSEYISFWSLYGHLEAGGLDCLEDFLTKEEAVEALEKVSKKLQAEIIIESLLKDTTWPIFWDTLTEGEWNAINYKIKILQEYIEKI